MMRGFWIAFGGVTSAVIALWPVSAGHANAAGVRPEGTLRMVRRLAEVADQMSVQTPYMNAERVEHIRGLLPPAHPPDRMALRLLLVQELLKAGDPLAAIRELEEVQRDPLATHPRFQTSILELVGLSHLRLSIQESCIDSRHPEACVLPIGGKGIHEHLPPLRKAAEAFSLLLEKDQGNLLGVWLLNLTHMYMGTYPHAIPAAWRIPADAFDSDYDVGRFREVAFDLGLGVVSHAGGSIVEDLDGDGYLDIMASSWGLRDPLVFFRNNADGSFSDRSTEAGLDGLTGGLNIVHADYDNDGNPDVLVLRGAWLGAEGHHPNSLLRTNGAGTFVDVTEEAGLLSFHPTQTAAWADYDNDGWLDLFVGNESTPADANPCELFHNNGDGTFTNVAEAAGVAATGFVKGVVWGDYDNDGLIDLYLSDIAGYNRLYRNVGRAGSRGPWRFEDTSRQARVRDSHRSFTTWFWDYDNDGWLDLFVSGYNSGIFSPAATVALEYLGLPSNAEKPRHFHNNGDGTFTDLAVQGELNRFLLTMGGNFGDLDNDGYPDFYVGTGETDLSSIIPNRMFRNDGGRRFQDVTTSGGFGHLQKGHGIAFGDLDNDGDQDLYVEMGGAYTGDVFRNLLFENPGHGNRWITLRLEGVRSNRSAIGARIRILVSTPAGDRAVYATVTTGGSFGASSLQQEIGLGQAQGIRTLEVRWPATGDVQTFSDIPMDRIYRLREGDRKLEPVPLARLVLGQGGL